VHCPSWHVMGGCCVLTLCLRFHVKPQQGMPGRVSASSENCLELAVCSICAASHVSIADLCWCLIGWRWVWLCFCVLSCAQILQVLRTQHCMHSCAVHCSKSHTDLHLPMHLLSGCNCLRKSAACSDKRASTSHTLVWPLAQQRNEGACALAEYECVTV
jgi:hypothetical protein